MQLGERLAGARQFSTFPVLRQSIEMSPSTFMLAEEIETQAEGTELMTMTESEMCVRAMLELELHHS